MSNSGSKPSAPAPLPRGIPNITGTVLDGRYKVGRVLGSGGMGAVFEATHLRLNHQVAVKVLKPTLMHRDDYVERFLREAQAASRIRHSNVVEIIDYGEMKDGTVYTVMELLLGEDLSARLKRIGRMEWKPSRWMLVQIVRALGAAHAQGIIHRDIKPANCFIMRGVEGQEMIKVLDFGIAKLDQLEEGQRALTGTSEILGTPSYMAPEMARGISADPRSEVYSIGVLAYRMLGGKVPFDGNNAFDVLLQHATQAPPPLQSLVSSLPPKVVELVHQLLQKDPETRPQDMGTVEQMLLSLDDQGQPCQPNPASVMPIHPSSSASASLPRSVTAGGVHPTPSGALNIPQPRPPGPPKAAPPKAPPPMRPGAQRPPGPPPSQRPTVLPPQRPTAPPRQQSGPTKLRSRPPGISASSPSNPPTAPRPAPDAKKLGTAKTVFAPVPTSERPNTNPPPGGKPKPSPPRGASSNVDKTQFDGPRPKLPPVAQPDEADRTMLAPSLSPGAKPGAGFAGLPPPPEPDSVDRTMLAPSLAPGAKPGAGFAGLPPPPEPDSVDRTMLAPSLSPGAKPGAGFAGLPPPPEPDAVDRTMLAPSAAGPGGLPSLPGIPPEPDAVDRTMIQPPSAPAAAAAPLPGRVDRTEIHEPLARPGSVKAIPPAAAPESVDRTMLQPQPGLAEMLQQQAPQDLAERTVVHPPSLDMVGGPAGDAPKRTMMLDNQPAKPAMADRTMVLADQHDLPTVPFTGGAQMAGLQATGAPGMPGTPGMPGAPNMQGAPNPAAPPGGGYPPAMGMAHSAPIGVMDPHADSKEGGKSWVLLAVLGALIAVGAGGAVAYVLFAGDDEPEVAQAGDDGKPEGETPAGGDDAGSPADDGTPPPGEGDGATPAADDGSAPPVGDDGGTPTADDGAAADDGTPAADDGGADDGAVADDGGAGDDGSAAGDDGAAPPEPEPEPKPKPEPKTTKPKGPPSDSAVKKRITRAAVKKCKPAKNYTVSFLIGLGGDLKVPSVVPRDATSNCILDVVRSKGKFRKRSTTSRERMTISK